MLEMWVRLGTVDGKVFQNPRAEKENDLLIRVDGENETKTGEEMEAVKS